MEPSKSDTAAVADGRACVRRHFRVVVAGTISTVFAAWLWFRPGGAPAAEVASDVGLLAASLTAGWACLRRTLTGGSSRRGWRLTALSCLLWSGAQATWTVSQLVFHRALPFPSPADVAYLGAIVVGIAALFAFPSAPQALPHRLRSLVDGLIVGLALLLIGWVTVLASVVHSSPATVPWHRALTLAYPLGDIARMSVALMVVAGARRSARNLSLLATGLGVLAVTDCVYAYGLNANTYRTGDLLDAGWMVAFLLVALAASSPASADDDAARPFRAHIVGPYLPVVAVGVVLGTGWLHGARLSGFEMWNAVAVVALGAVRQVLTHLENLTLTSQLEAGVEEIRRREGQLNEAQSLARLGSWEVDLASGEVTASETLYHIAGYESGGIEPNLESFRALVHPDDLDAYKRSLSEALASGRGGSLDYRSVGPDGRVTWKQSRFEVITQSDGRHSHLRGTSQDITERKQAEQALRQSDERLRCVVEASPLAIIEFEPGGAVRFWNPAAEAMYGWAGTEVEGQPPPFSTPDGSGRFDELFRRVLAGEHIHNVELVRRRKDKETLHVSVSMAPLWGPDGDVVGVSSAGLDITRQRQLEDELGQAQKMEAVGRLAGGIAHDFNNILTVVIGQAEMLLEEIDPVGPEAVRVSAMRRAARRAAELTDQLLTFSRRQVRMGEPADLNAVVASMEPMLGSMLGEHVELVVRLCEGGLIVPADRSQIEQVLLNLVVNARDAMPAGGRLTITTAAASVPSGPAQAVLRVADTGTGMEEETRARVFEPFFTTKPEGEGTGLGLSTTYGIARQHGGAADVSSVPGAGSVFTVSLPVIGPTFPRLAKPAVKERGDARGTVLLVEDEATVRALAFEILVLHGHLVLQAADGAEALAMAQAHPGTIDVLLTDVVLPQIPGPELARQLVAACPGLQVIFMSGYAERHLAGVERHDVRFLAKPFRPADLATGVAEAVVSARMSMEPTAAA
jgi:PAS domain S-box-containing protein